MIIPYIGGVRNAVCSLYIIVELGKKPSDTNPKGLGLNARSGSLFAAENEILGKECMKTACL